MTRIPLSFFSGGGAFGGVGSSFLHNDCLLRCASYNKGMTLELKVKVTYS